MTNGKLRCIGSAQRLKNRFGKGFQVEMKVKGPTTSDEDTIKISQFLLKEALSCAAEVDVFSPSPFRISPKLCTTVSTANTFIHLEDTLSTLNTLTGNDSLSSVIKANDKHGHPIYKAATSEIGLSIDTLATFCAHELRVNALKTFMHQHYCNNVVVRERQDSKIRFEVGLDGVNIGSLFGLIETHKAALWLADYGVSQTSLEQVFNTKVSESFSSGAGDELPNFQ
eukprot:CAMPEP_0194385722 /NCGR_PEP_ID=MMETSP0174-20130528/82130_1 /TAXON_ID=216777 /ORGANISM="Proboscia alata, Strain PI-D3" /LENGTH=225 /DNA_ID=CAMNT_0039174145 /DNA_START=94 /DNA_END=771 /DNA_ORIENTATION=+